MKFFKNFLLVSLFIVAPSALVAMEKDLESMSIAELEEELNRIEQELETRTEAGRTELQRHLDEQGIQEFSYKRSSPGLTTIFEE